MTTPSNSTDPTNTGTTPVATDPTRDRVKIILLLTTVALVGYTLLTQWYYKKEQALLRTHLTLLSQQNQTKANHFQHELAAILKKEKNLKTRMQTLEKALQQTVHTALPASEEWLLLSARYCVQLAQINDHWGHNPDATLSLLQQANTLLASFHEEPVFAIRQALEKDIVELKGQTQIDEIGLLSKLDALNSDIDDLTLQPRFTMNKNTTTAPPASTSWKAHLKNSLTQLKTLIVIRQYKDNDMPLPILKESALLRQNLRFYLQEAQWAILQTNELVYHNALHQALHLLQRAFNQPNKRTQIMMDTIQELNKTLLCAKKHSFTPALTLLNQYILSRANTVPTLPLSEDIKEKNT